MCKVLMHGEIEILTVIPIFNAWIYPNTHSELLDNALCKDASVSHGWKIPMDICFISISLNTCIDVMDKVQTPQEDEQKHDSKH